MRTPSFSIGVASPIQRKILRYLSGIVVPRSSISLKSHGDLSVYFLWILSNSFLAFLIGETSGKLLRKLGSSIRMAIT
jgi:hypothetical protein